ncbi:MAG: AGE family epimerase/isomerase, partial [Candidatus Helarchaeota archaeon]|nr:AGE family epimerase/isomerase [Candidatus Helarchaeota archaeon]
MKKKIGSLFILCMLCLSSMIIIFQNSPFTPLIHQNEGNSEEELLIDDPISTNDVADYSKQGEDVNNPRDSADFSELYYKYKNATLFQANATIEYLISNLWDLSFKGFNDSDATDAKKRTFDNMLMIITLLAYHDMNPQAEYISFAEEIFNFEYNFLWDNQSNLFLSYCDYNGNNPSSLTNSSDNVLAIVALSKLFEATGNQTYLEIANSTYTALNSVFYDTTKGGYFRSNASGDNNKFTYDNLLVSTFLSEIYRIGYLSLDTRVDALEKAENTLNLVISYYLNGTFGFFLSGDINWTNLNEEKSALINALAIDTLVSLYDLTSNQTYLEIAVNIAEFINTAFWDSNGINRGYNTTVTWDGSTTLNSTKYLEVNSLIMAAFLKLFEKTYNSTHYLDALNISRFLNTYLLDSSTNAFNYSVDFTFVSSNSSLKSTAANAWVIQALLNYRYPRPYLTRANTTMTMVENYMYSNDGFDSLIMYDWSTLTSQVISEFPIQITLEDLFNISKSPSSNLYSINTVLELADETRLDDYLLLANKTMYFLNQTAFSHAFSDNITELSYSTKTNAWGILSLLNLYEKTNDTLFLEMANETWFFLRDSFWDNVTFGYNTSTSELEYKNLVSNCLMIWANLAILNSTHIIFDNTTRGNASVYVNQTINIINQKMWDGINFGYYSNASSDWTPITTEETAKKIYENSIMIQTLLKYNDFYPNNPNHTLYEDRINKTIEFLFENLWDNEVGGFYLGCDENGTSQIAEKYTYGNNWATLTFLELYKNTGNFSYYLLAEKTNNFVNTYLWDFEHGGYFHRCSEDGVPIISGTISGASGTILVAFKYLDNQISSVLTLTRLSALKNAMEFPLIVDIEFDPDQIDRGALGLQITLKLIDIEGVPINQANISISTSGLYQTIATEIFYGFTDTTNLENQNGNNFSSSLDISPFLGKFHLTVSAYNSSMASTWLYITNTRTFDAYLSKAFTLLTGINIMNFDQQYGGYVRSATAGLNLTKYTFDNLMGILALLEFINGSGLNLAYNLTTSDFEQSLTTYIFQTFKFLNDTLLFSPTNITTAFFSNAQVDGSNPDDDILCKDTALAIIALLEYFQLTNNTDYLDMANKTWVYLNTTFWDTEYSGYMHVNGTEGNQTKYSVDNIWAIMANLAIYNVVGINNTIRNSALEMANLTLQLLNQSIWDNVYSGFYSSFNGSTWVPFNTSFCKQAEVNILAVQAFIEFADLINDSKRDVYIKYANETFIFINQYLKDNEFLGYFSSINRNGTEIDTNKTLSENSLMILALLDLYRINNYNYTYYQLAEEIIYFIDHYFRSPYATIYHNISSKVGAIFFNIDDYVPTESYSNFLFLRGLIKTDLQQQNMDYPLVIDDIAVESPQLGEIQNTVNITVKINDSNGNPVENATVIGIIYGIYQVFSFTQLTNNTYYSLVNVSSMAGSLNISFLAFKEGYSAGIKEYSFSRILPTYIQKGYETLIALIVRLWSDTENILYKNEINYQFDSFANFLAIEALLDFAEIGGNILWLFNWFANRTLISFAELIANNLKNVLNSSIVQVDSQNVSGYISETENDIPVNRTECTSNAQAIISFLELYNKTGEPSYLELANSTWLYFNETFWDPINFGYFPDNSSSSSEKKLYDNCLAILANLAINQASGINPSIRNQAFVLANATFYTMNQSLWDNVSGTYYSHCDNNWSNPQSRHTDANALMILTLLELYSHNSTQTRYLHRANITAEIFINSFYDSEDGGFYQYLYDNFTAPVNEPGTWKYLSDNAWAILALTELYKINRNTSYYYMAEEGMNFVNTHLANHFNEYLNTQIDDINGYWDISNKSGFVIGKPYGKYIGSLEPTALIIQALLKLYNIANLTLPWLNTTVQIIPASDPPTGEYCNLTISIVDENGMNIKADLNITVVGWKREPGGSRETILQDLEHEYDSNTQEYKVKNVDLSALDDFYFHIFVKNSSYATWWNAYYLRRANTSIPIIWGVGGDYVPSENYWQYTIGEDVVIIEILYMDDETLLGIPGATLNFTVYFPNATIWFSELVITNSTGWGQFIFGPIPNIAELFGLYYVTVYTSHANNLISPITWYASTDASITINIDYGVSIPFFYPLEPFVGQGDKVPCNVTLKHRMKANLTVDISIASEGVLIPITLSKNLTTGYNSFLIEAEVDERTTIGTYFIYINVSYENKVIRDSFFFINIVSAAIIRNYYVPTWVAEDDVRYAVIEFEHRKIWETSNISVKIDCAALEENSMVQVLQPSTWQEYYFPLIVKNDIPYGVYSGEIVIERVNYTLEFENASLTFQIEVKSSIEVTSIHVPSELAQNQGSFIAIEVQNNKVTQLHIKIVGYGDGFNNQEEIFMIDPAETETINIPLRYYKNPWDTGIRE